LGVPPAEPGSGYPLQVLVFPIAQKLPLRTPGFPLLSLTQKQQFFSCLLPLLSCLPNEAFRVVGPPFFSLSLTQKLIYHSTFNIHHFLISELTTPN
jgi:hypothetical protein